MRTASGRFSDGSDLLDGADRIGRAERPSSRAVTDVVTEQPSLGAAQVAPRRAVQARTAAARSARQGSHGGEPGRWRRDRRSGGLVDRLAGDPGFLGRRARRCASAQLWVLGTWRVPVQTRTCPCRAEVEIIGVFGGGWTLPDVRAVGTWTLPGSTVGLSFGWLPPCSGPAALAFLSPGGQRRALFLAGAVMGAAQDTYERVRQCFNRHDLDGLRALTAGSTVIVRPTPGQRGTRHNRKLLRSACSA